MLSEKMVQLGTNRSVIRDLFEYGNKRKAEKEGVHGGTGRRQLYGEKDYHYQS